MLALGIKLSLSIALVFGSSIAATDPDATVALFRALGVPTRISVLNEGGSLFNEGSAIVVFILVLVIVLIGKYNHVNSQVWFFTVSIGGIVLGLVLDWLIAQLISNAGNNLLEVIIHQNYKIMTKTIAELDILHSDAFVSVQQGDEIIFSR